MEAPTPINSSAETENCKCNLNNVIENMTKAGKEKIPDFQQTQKNPQASTLELNNLDTSTYNCTHVKLRETYFLNFQYLPINII